MKIVLQFNHIFHPMFKRFDAFCGIQPSNARIRDYRGAVCRNT